MMTGEAKLREWAREHMPKIRYAPPLEVDNAREALYQAGESLIRQCAEIVRKYPTYHERDAPEIAAAILREFGMEER